MKNKAGIRYSVFGVRYPGSDRIRNTEYRLGGAASAFTLVEVIAAITILALITGSVYALLRQSFQAAADLQHAEREDQALRHFLDLCRSTLETLPPDAALSLAMAEETGSAQELTLSGVPEAFSVGPEPISASDLILGLRLLDSGQARDGGDALFEVAISREEFAPKAEAGDFQVRASSDDNFYQPDDQGRYWLPLLTGVRSLEWRYWDDANRLWEEDWSNAPGRPALLEMQLWPENRPAPLRVVFSLPVATVGSGASTAEGGDSGVPAPNTEGRPPPPDAAGGPPGASGGRSDAEEPRRGGRGSKGRPSKGERGREAPGDRRSGDNGRGRARDGFDQPRDGRERGGSPQNFPPAPANPGSSVAPRAPVPSLPPR